MSGSVRAAKRMLLECASPQEALANLLSCISAIVAEYCPLENREAFVQGAVSVFAVALRESLGLPPRT